MIRELLHEGGTFIDVGANVGTMSVAAALSAGPSGTVIAFEPNPALIPLLKINARRHRVDTRLIIKNQAVGARSASSEMFFYENSLLSGEAEALQEFQPGASTKRVVDFVSLDDVIGHPVSMLKVDVEGFELEVLQGSTRVLSDNQDIAVIVEINLSILDALNRSQSDIFACFPRSEWSTYLINESNDRPLLERIDQNLDADMISRKHPYANVLAVRNAADRVPQHLLELRPKE